MTEYFYLCKSLPRNFLLYKSKVELNRNNYFMFRTKNEAYTFWRSYYLMFDIINIENYFNKWKGKYFYYHIFVLVENIKTKKTIQYLLEDINSEIVINKIREGYKTLRLLDEDYSISFFLV